MTTQGKPSRTPGEVGVERAWASLGILFNCLPGPASPDLERLLLDTARAVPGNARLLPLVVTWLVQYAPFVARHRLKRLVVDELELCAQPVLGLLLASAVERGASRDLLLAAEACRRAEPGAPLYDVQRESAGLARIAEQNASELSKRWGVWAPSVELRPEAVRPVEWVLARNPSYRERAVRKGDLRVSIIESLTRDCASGAAPSSAALARLAGATRRGVRQAIEALVLEGVVVIGSDPVNDRDRPVALRGAA